MNSLVEIIDKYNIIVKQIIKNHFLECTCIATKVI